MILGFTQITVSLTVNMAITLAAGSIAVFLTRHPRWIMIQRWLMGSVLTALAFRMAREGQR